MKKPTKLLNLVGFSTVCISTGGERGTTIYQIFKNAILLKIRIMSINTMLYKCLCFIWFWISFDKFLCFWINVG